MPCWEYGITVSNYCVFVACAAARENSLHTPQLATSFFLYMCSELPQGTSYASRENKIYSDTFESKLSV